MRTAEQVLGVIRDRGTRNLPLEDIYRQLYNKNLYLLAYARLYRNNGAMTPGTTAETVDGMSLAKIDQLIEQLRFERYRWTPVRRTYIPKKNGKKRPLGLPTWSDKLLQEVIRLILEAYYEPQFSPHSHGFRPTRGCHTALGEIVTEWTGTKWFIEGDISGCFDNIDHTVLLSLLAEKLHDNRFLRLIGNLLKAGYLEEWAYHKTISGTPQGGVVSPILANIYLDQLDKYVEQVLQPAYTQGHLRKVNRNWVNLKSNAQYHRKQGHHEHAKALTKAMQQLPSGDPNDPEYRRLRYVRYADDFLLGFVGTRQEAEAIKQHLQTFLRTTLNLEMSAAKSLITHATTQAARFLGYEILNQQANDKHCHGRRSVNGRIALRVPADVIRKYCALYQKQGKPAARPTLVADDDFTIIARYQAEYRGIVQYYLLAHNVSSLWKLTWVMQTSLLKTLAWKHKSSVSKMHRRYRTFIETSHGPMKCLQLVVERDGGKKPLIAQFGGIPLRRKKDAILVDRLPSLHRTGRSELIQRLLADECELCGATGDCEVHHIKKLANLKGKGRKEKPIWVQIMAARRRKTLVVCQSCHRAIHAGKAIPPKHSD
jgi:group II intron reverse transcriptase/maturase